MWPASPFAGKLRAIVSFVLLPLVTRHNFILRALRPTPFTTCSQSSCSALRVPSSEFRVPRFQSFVGQVDIFVMLKFTILKSFVGREFRNRPFCGLSTMETRTRQNSRE